MNMVRSFLPVGQGAFYTEQFDGGVNVIYDCGSQTGVEIVEKMIESTFDKGEEIHAVFISHLHSDHINGLEFLLKHCKVETLYLPYLTPHNISISELIQDVTQGGCTQFVRAFIHDSHGTLKMYCERNEIELPEIKYVLSQDDANKMGQQIEPNDKRYLFPGEPVYIPVASPGARWKYIPYNVQNTERKIQPTQNPESRTKSDLQYGASPKSPKKILNCLPYSKIEILTHILTHTGVARSGFLRF